MIAILCSDWEQAEYSQRKAEATQEWDNRQVKEIVMIITVIHYIQVQIWHLDQLIVLSVTKMLEKTNLKKINFLFSSRFPRLQSMVISPISMGQQGDRASWWWEHMTVVAVDFKMSGKPETRDNVYLLMNTPVICSLQLSSISFLLSPKCHHNENPAVFYVLIRPELSWSGHLLMTESTSWVPNLHRGSLWGGVLHIQTIKYP